MKEKALARLAEANGYESRFQAPDPDAVPANAVTM